MGGTVFVVNFARFFLGLLVVLGTLQTSQGNDDVVG